MYARYTETLPTALYDTARNNLGDPRDAARLCSLITCKRVNNDNRYNGFSYCTFHVGLSLFQALQPGGYAETRLCWTPSVPHKRF